MKISSMDIYVTYRCNLRCAHCYVGERLNTNRNMDYDMFERIIARCKEWQTEVVSFLGGEPTLYPHIVPAIKQAQALGLNTRLVSNGTSGFAKFLQKFDGETLPYLYFSIDGSNEAGHDAVRGPGVFRQLITNVKRARELGYRATGVISLHKRNAHDAVATVKLVESLGLECANIHFVTDRGFAGADMVLSIPEWFDVCKKLNEAAKDLTIPLRVEKTFLPGIGTLPSCAVHDQSNMVVYPDGRVYFCNLFIDLPDGHSYTWTNDGLLPNQNRLNERTICAESGCGHCPAMRYVNQDVENEARRQNFTIGCIYNKDRILPGVSRN